MNVNQDGTAHTAFLLFCRSVFYWRRHMSDKITEVQQAALKAVNEAKTLAE